MNWKKTQQILGWTNQMVDRIFCHQVGSAHRKLLYKTLELDPLKDYSTLEYLGNTGSVSLPTTMAIALEKSPPKSKDKIAMLGIGSGLKCLMLGVGWGTRRVHGFKFQVSSFTLRAL